MSETSKKEDKGLFGAKQESKYRGKGKEKTSPTSEITTSQEGKEENKLMTQGDTQRQKVQRDKGSGAWPLLLGHRGVRGLNFTHQESTRWACPLSGLTFPPAARQPGRWPDGQRQTDTLTEALQEERRAPFLYRNTATHETNRERQSTEKQQRRGEDGGGMNETWGAKHDWDEEMDGWWMSGDVKAQLF